MGRTHTKTDVVVEVVYVVIVAIGATRVPLIIVEGTTAQHTAFHRSAPSPEGDTRIIRQKFPAFGGRGSETRKQKSETQNLSGEDRGRTHTKTDEVVERGYDDIDAIGATREPHIIEEGTTAQHTEARCIYNFTSIGSIIRIFFH